MFPLDDTIAAIASAPGGAARGIVRLSGPDVVACVARCFQAGGGRNLRDVHYPTVVPGRMILPSPLAPLPCDLYLWPGERSYTRQPSAEVHTFGSPPLLEMALETLCGAGARLAEPGEFTMRAFLAGRLDLTQAEAVLGVIDAQSRRELDVALSQLAGGLTGPLHEIRNRLLDLLAHLEAGLDFVDEDIEFISAAELERQLDEAADVVRTTAEQMIARGAAPEAWRVAIVGWPNVGKSSLWNALAGESAALVSEQAGTTRDYLRRRVAWDHLSLELVDTAGIEPDAVLDDIASAAQAMTSEQTAQAHLVLFCLDGARPLNRWEVESLARPQGAAPRIVVATKADLPSMLVLNLPHIPVSSVTGAGLENLRSRIAETIAASHEETAVVAGTAIRCREGLRLAADSLHRARDAAAHGLGEELIAAEVRIALDELGKVVGRIYTDDVLDRIFSRFCIGK
ncbi:MAG: tRNA modification GTPase [Planctomycetes bacterium]|nr:tRNA modification GTPase [Planctomycetota bacterium]